MQIKRLGFLQLIVINHIDRKSIICVSRVTKVTSDLKCLKLRKRYRFVNLIKNARTP